MGIVATMTIAAEHETALAERPAADRFMRRLLRVDSAGPATATAARRAFQTSVLVAAVRCLLTYIVLPFVAPVLGVAAGVTPVVGAVVGLVAIAANVASVRRFWRAEHRYRWHYTALASVIVSALVWLVVADAIDLVT